MALTKEAAQAITADLDRLAQLFEADHKALGIPTNVAKDFAYRCDLLSDFVEKRAAEESDSIQKEFNQEVDTQHESDEPYMATKTHQDELYELGNMVESGGLGKAALKEIAAKVAELLKASDEDEDEKDADDEEEEDADKKATLVNLANSLLRLAGDDEDADEGDEDADEGDDGDDEDADEGGKEASFAHGYAL